MFGNYSLNICDCQQENTMSALQSRVNIAVINESTTVTDIIVKDVIDACQVQLDRDYFPIWNQSATLAFFSKTQTVPADHWVIVILDNSDAAGALGYHDLSQSGMPMAKVFAGDDIKYGLAWSVTFSHELLEMLGDPDINQTVFIQTQTGGQIFAFENCDACEDDRFSYNINGVKVSDFVTPNWFNVYATAGSKFDFCGHVTQPFEILSGGYIGMFDISNPNQGWTQIQAQNVMPARTLIESTQRNNPMRGRLTKRNKGQGKLIRSTK